MRLIGVAVVIGLLIAGALFLGGEEEGKQKDVPTAADGPTPVGACEEIEAPEVNAQQYEEAPPLDLSEGVDYSAVIQTTCGEITMDLLEEKAPQNVANFVFLANEGFYDGILWHRVEQNSVIQTGDPDGQNGSSAQGGVDGPGYGIPDEFPKKANEYLYGVVGMANTGQGDTAGSQFFIVVHDPTRQEPAGYQPLYSIFAEVDEASYPVLHDIQRQPTQGGSDPVEAVKPVIPIYITSIDIVEN
jgi:peptidylprolyl isomerase